MSWRRVVLLVASMLVSISAYATDWRVYADVTDKDELWLYSASDLVRDGNNVRVWTEVLSEKDINKFVEDNKEHPEVIGQRIADRVKAGYRPPYAVFHNFDGTSTGIVLIMEEIADERGAPAKSKTLYEFDCAGGRIRTLQFSNLVPGEEATLTVPLPWQYIAPDSIVATLKSWVCKRD